MTSNITDDRLVAVPARTLVHMHALVRKARVKALSGAIDRVAAIEDLEIALNEVLPREVYFAHQGDTKVA